MKKRDIISLNDTYQIMDAVLVFKSSDLLLFQNLLHIIRNVESVK